MKAFSSFAEVQMKRKFIHFCYPVNCSNMFFERVLLRFGRLNAE